MEQSWSLEDVAQIAKGAPYTFYLPPKSVTSKLGKDSLVKLMFKCDVDNDKGWSAERMWVIVTKRDGDNFTGLLDNDPYYIPDIKAGDALEFKIAHILQTSIEDTTPSVVDKYLPRCYVTSSVLHDKNSVFQLFREKPTEEEKEKNYSGWNLFSGLEDDDYLNNPDNWNYVSLGAVLNIDDRFVHLLESEFASEYAWDDSTESYLRI